MARVRKNLLLQGLSGALGEQFVLREGRRCTIVSNFPTFAENRTFTEAQVDRQSKFREAVAYAKGAKGWAVYVEKAKVSNRTPYHVAISDFCHAPEITKVDTSAWSGQAGQVIRIQAVDDVQVTQVKLAITDSAGTILEQGAAIQDGDLWWSYTTTTSASDSPSIVVTARDLPGNMVEKVMEQG